MCFCCFSDEPPQKVDAKGSRGAAGGELLAMKDNPNQMALGMKDACCAEPCCCCLSSLGAPLGCTACWARKAVLEKYHNGVDDFMCCQGYIPKFCCCDVKECCKGSIIGLCCEGCCCPILSISIARIHMMHSKNARPDPCDWKLIQCSNCLQLTACICHILAIFIDGLREAAQIIDCIADIFTCSVAGCMGAQIHHEIKKDADGIKEYPVVVGTPISGAPENSEMAR
jgi:hypothetical protein